MSVTPKLDDLVQSVSLYTRIPTILHLYVLPFILIYSAWVYTWLGVYGFSDHYEGGFVGLAAIGCLQILCCLACYWSVHINSFCTCKREKDPNRATIAKVIPTPNNGSSELVWLRHTKKERETTVWFIFQKTKYIWDPDKKTFRGLEFPINKSFAEYMSYKGYQEETDVQQADQLYGKNEVDMIVPEFMELFIERATAPFFVFQVFCVALWCLDDFWYYSLFTLVMLVLFECTLVQQQLRNMDEIRKMGNKPYNILVYRNRKWRMIPSCELIPGDVISITRSQKDNLIPCDVLLLRGSCIVDESMLTGESVPQMKEAIENFDPDTILDPEGDGKLHVLFGVHLYRNNFCRHQSAVAHTPTRTTVGLRPQDNGCVAYVLRTGFNTSQGKLLRTILFGVKRVTANNKETFGFILFLLIFAIAAAWYVWVKGCEDPKRNRYKLFLECTLILTSVIPPELPIELSLAVNTSLIALSKLGVYCTEPFRIPFAGKVDICCFDKTGTLTSDDLIVLATCHSLAQLNEGLVGDPLEKATLIAIDWNVTKADAVVPKKGKSPVKGAPETLKGMFAEIPEKYDEVYLELSRRGARVLALGYREIGKLSSQEFRDITREQVEKDFRFAGFVIISCPLKNDSEIRDNPLTACHVAKELKFITKPILALTQSDSTFIWQSIDEKERLQLDYDHKSLVKKYDLCITGDGLNYLREYYNSFLRMILPNITVFARFAPKQKEFVVVQLKNLGYTTLMCGDGTNDVGALKHAEVGVAILANAPERLPDIKEQKEKLEKLEKEREKKQKNLRRPRLEKLQAKVDKMMKELEEQDQPQVVKLGDASIASPFTSKLSSIMCICHIIKQGRCTLVTTLQMFKILALNALILAYTQSVLYLDGIKLRDMQATLQGLLLAACFLFISRSKPLKVLSKQRPLPNIFNLYTILTVILQFMVHFLCLIYLVQEAKVMMPEVEKNTTEIASSEEMTDEEKRKIIHTKHWSPLYGKFKGKQSITVQYFGVRGVVLALTLGILPDLSAQLEIIDFPPDFRIMLLKVLFADFFFSFLVDKVCLWLCGEGGMKMS
ncbi:hypothetical protein NQ317_009636 [Molorchus minor]|uniref:Cation-transporting ATPase 13A1 n=1 Tax=Molorchus minor TaxID=1323400 RepID=A0ABQ9IV25_9CUCU|nr:hypothetical protein NQ317_009636 [Molorchus minor]